MTSLIFSSFLIKRLPIDTIPQRFLTSSRSFPCPPPPKKRNPCTLNSNIDKATKKLGSDKPPVKLHRKSQSWLGDVWNISLPPLSVDFGGNLSVTSCVSAVRSSYKWVIGGGHSSVCLSIFLLPYFHNHLPSTCWLPGLWGTKPRFADPPTLPPP